MTASRLRASGVAYLAAVLATVAVAAAQTPPPASPAKTDLFGRPTGFKLGKQPAVAIWYDTLWHVEFTTAKKSKVAFTGSVRADKGPIVGFFDALDKAKKKADGDEIAPHPDGGGFDFRFSNKGGTDILRFKLSPAATKLTFNVALDGVPATKQVMLGKDGKNPDAMPFSLPANPKP